MIYNRTELTSLYNKARKAYAKCIQMDENAYLKEEVPIPLEQIELKNLAVKIVFHEENVESDSIEVSIGLWNKFSIIGKYVYIEDNQGIIVDDGLVFY